MNTLQTNTPEKEKPTARGRFVRGFRTMMSQLRERLSVQPPSFEARDQQAPGLTGLALQLLSETGNGEGRRVVTIHPEGRQSPNDVTTQWQGKFEVGIGTASGRKEDGTTVLPGKSGIGIFVGERFEALMSLGLSVSKNPDGTAESSYTLRTRTDPGDSMSQKRNRRIVVGADGRVTGVFRRTFENGTWAEYPISTPDFDDENVGALLHAVYLAVPHVAEAGPRAE
jgi:hypothetical protein